MKIDFANLQKAHLRQQTEIEEAVLHICRNANYIMGEEVEYLEKELEAFIGNIHAISCSSGTDALLLALMALGIKNGDEVITTSFSFIATAEIITLLGAKPVFVDISLEDYNLDVNLIQAVITPKTKAILAVSLYGQPPNIAKLQEIATQNSLALILDGAQSFGATFQGQKDSMLCNITTTSFFPSKPLGCYGDGGAVFTKDANLAQIIKSLRIHGQTKRYFHRYIGIGGRLDSIQAAILRIKLKVFTSDIKKRQDVANKYHLLLQGSNVILPKIAKDRTSVFAQYTLRVKNRSLVQEKLKKCHIPTAIHYPLGFHLQECFQNLGYKKGDFPCTELASEEVLSIPMNPYLTDEEIQYIAQCIRQVTE
ncbi:aminotransferase DegT [Helicobacter monodelphidis]|uniref:DegT/DnrJ/EryC1/StrS family aminotransferase n=1 Tax=Helicobacter sp. 15-1451 TaxID=2004995 RepID=UPI000DCCE2A2|nr:DegT/DnrJ/EryC1/StrS family aminotransferase [Helicobacter sp. 15-1451]RAX57585.1 aminotransferase DegT [Helicobacter sp. 15-1451]